MKIAPHSVWIGTNNDSEQLLGFGEASPVSDRMMIFAGESVCVNAMIEVGESTLPARLSALLSHAFQTTSPDWLAAPVVVLLPQLGTIDHSSHPQLYASVCEGIPVMASHPACFLYPYGRSAMLLAWKRIEALLAEHKTIWVLAVDSDPRLCQAMQPATPSDAVSLATGVTATDCVIVAQCSAASEGFSREWFSYEALTKDKSDHTSHAAMDALFSRYHHACGLPIHQLYAPYTGDAATSEEWAMAYHHLDRAVGRYTQFVMNGAVVGELGACSGLYNLLHLYERYQRGIYRHPTFQVESSEMLYRGAALYTWQP